MAVAVPPPNDPCSGATAVIAGTPLMGTVAEATPDGNSLCAFGPTPDVYHTFTTGPAGTYTFSLCGGNLWDTVISLHTGCPATALNEIACDDDGCRPPGAIDFGYASTLALALPASTSYIIRIGGYDPGVAFGSYTLLVTAPATPTGACCFAGTCSLQTQAICQAAFGNYLGNYTHCIADAGLPRTYPTTGSVPFNIPDAVPAGVSTSVTVTDLFVVGDVGLTISMNHTFIGDLRITLSNGATTVVLVQKPGGGALGDDSNLSGTYTFTDSAATTIWAAALAAPGTNDTIAPGAYLATDAFGNVVSLRSAFNGSNSARTWTVNVSDNFPTDTGQVQTWSLILDRSAGDPCGPTGACCSALGCTITIQGRCTGGWLQGTACAPDPCTSSPGACCTGTPQGGIGTTCTVVTQNQCLAAGGLFQGYFTPCSDGTGNPTSCCRVNFNHVGGVEIGDVFAFISGWFALLPATDWNANSFIEISDIFNFLTSWFAGCPS